MVQRGYLVRCSHKFELVASKFDVEKAGKYIDLKLVCWMIYLISEPRYRDPQQGTTFRWEISHAYLVTLPAVERIIEVIHWQQLTRNVHVASLTM